MRSASSSSTPIRTGRSRPLGTSQQGGARSRGSATAPTAPAATSYASAVPRGSAGLVAGGGDEPSTIRVELLRVAVDELQRARYSSGVRSRRRASSASARTRASGVRSSCESSAEKRRSWRKLAAIRSSSPSSVAASSVSSSCGSPTAEAAVEVVLAPRRGLPRHLDDGPERRLQQPARRDAAQQEQSAAKTRTR